MDIIGSHILHNEAIGLHHLGYQLAETGAMAPAKLGQGLLRIAEQQIDLGWSAIRTVDRPQHPPGPPATTLLVVALSMPHDGPPDLMEGELDKLAHGVRLASRQDIVVRMLLLQDAPHAFDIVACMTPVAPGVEIAEKEPVLVATLDRSHGARDLARHECLAADRRFMI